MAVDVESLQVEVDGGSLAAIATGPAGATPLLLLHGITSNALAWNAVLRELGEGVRGVAPDLRGRAGSSGVEGGYGIARHVEDALAVIDAAGLGTPVVVGHSMGAYVAARLAAEHPERLRALVLVDGGLPLPVPEGADPDELLDATLGPAIARLAETFADRAANRAFWRRHPAFSGPEIADEDLAAWADRDMHGSEPALRPSVREEAVRADGRDLLADERTRHAVERVGAPGLVLRAPRGLLDDENAFIPAEQARTFAHPTLALREVDDVNHYSIILGTRGSAATVAAIREAIAY